MTREELDDLSNKILTASMKVHRKMGPGLLEGIYQKCLAHELRSMGINIDTMVPVPLIYDDHPLNKEYIIDFLVESEIILELKSVEVLLPVHEAQVISYLKLAGKRLGFLINFNVPLLKQGFRRFVNKF